jgi:hypothetical protein
MVARVIQGVVNEGKMDEVIRLLEDVIAPRLRQRDGFEQLLLMTHVGSGQAIAVTLWSSTEALEDSETSGFLDEQLAVVLPFLEEAASTRTFRVSGVV